MPSQVPALHHLNLKFSTMYKGVDSYLNTGKFPRYTCQEYPYWQTGNRIIHFDISPKDYENIKWEMELFISTCLMAL